MGGFIFLARPPHEVSCYKLFSKYLAVGLYATSPRRLYKRLWALRFNPSRYR